jgi:hypothetical protein
MGPDVSAGPHGTRSGTVSIGNGGTRLAMTERTQSTKAAATFAFGRWLVVGSIFAAAALQPGIAAAQQAPNSAANLGPLTLSPNQAAEPAGDALSPQNLLQLMYQYKTAPGTGPNGAPDTVTTETVKLRGDLSIELGSQWQLVLRGDLPYLAKNPFSDTDPDRAFIYGVGDADIQGALIRQLDDRWKVGAGVRFIAPTGGDTFGSGKWRIMPIAGVRYALPEISKGSYFEPLARYDVSFTGDPSRKSISNLQFAPLLNLALPDRMFLTFYPSADIRWNFGPPVTGQTGRLFLPMDARIGKKFTDNFNVSLEVGVPIIKQYPVYNFKTALRLNFTF